MRLLAPTTSHQKLLQLGGYVFFEAHTAGEEKHGEGTIAITSDETHSIAY